MTYTHSWTGIFRGVLAGILAACVLACAPPLKRPTGPAKVYEDAKEMFAKTRFDKVIDYTDELARAEPPNAYTERAQVLRIVLLSGLANGYRTLAEGYGDAVKNTKNPRNKAEYQRLGHDFYRYARTRSLELAEVAELFLKANVGGSSRQVTLEAPYPTVEAPIVNANLLRAREGGGIDAAQQEEAQLAGIRMGVEGSLADVLGGDRAKARTALQSSTAKVGNLGFTLYLGKQLLAASQVFGQKGMKEATNFKLLCSKADACATQALAILKANPDKEAEKKVKELQEDVKKTLKSG